MEGQTGERPTLVTLRPFLNCNNGCNHPQHALCVRSAIIQPTVSDGMFPSTLIICASLHSENLSSDVWETGCTCKTTHTWHNFWCKAGFWLIFHFKTKKKRKKMFKMQHFCRIIPLKLLCSECRDLKLKVRKAWRQCSVKHYKTNECDRKHHNLEKYIKHNWEASEEPEVQTYEPWLHKSQANRLADGDPALTLCIAGLLYRV